MQAFFQSLISSATPVLPGAGLLRFALPGAWAIILACGLMWLGRRWPSRVRLGLATLVAVVTLLAGPWSPAYYLSLAFQMPSLMTLLICVGWAAGEISGKRPALSLKPLAPFVVVLGWLLLLDALALLPVSIYHWGFTSIAVAVVALLACLPWVAAGRASLGLLGSLLPGSLLTLAVLALFVMTRLPTGNLWDALMDPWLWFACQGWCLARGWRYLRAVRTR